METSKRYNSVPVKDNNARCVYQLFIFGVGQSNGVI